MALQNIGILGYGKMGSAIATGLAQHGKTIYAYNPHKEVVPANYYQEAVDVVAKSDIIILAAKPHRISTILETIVDHLTSDKLILSIAAGVEVGVMKRNAHGKCPIIRSMPNLPAAVGKGVFALCFDDPALSETQKQEVEELFDLIGDVYILQEDKFDAFSGLVGSGPGFIFHVMEAFYEAAVTLGFSHKDARKVTIQTFSGSVGLAAKTPLSFYDLKQQVCSPKGITIQGVNHLEKKAVKSDIVTAILKAAKQL